MAESETPEGAVVVGLDRFAPAQVALDAAADEAARRRVGLHIVYAYPWLARARTWDFQPPREELEAGEHLLRGAAERAGAAHPGLAVTTRVIVLDPAAALVDASAIAAVVVVGAGGQDAPAGHLGSVAQKVVAHAHGPVVVVRNAPPHPDGPVVVGMDPDDGASEAIEYAFEEAVRRGVGVTVVQGIQVEGARRAWDDRAVQRRLDEVLTRAEQETRTRLGQWRSRFPEVPTRLEQTRDHPVDALVRAAASAGIVVVGSRGRGDLVGLLVGSVSRGVLHRAPVVAVVRTHRPRARPAPER
ncbi:universal stress protein [Georgenia sp. SYP-B2076]|uniref:universal stress protein n=1 Tax=Georgenia sp. SYP-B2076 TaxID=2495881 RepID=UPI000F8ED694|nr:universal stress protein [Georgenia sp. SYP-B2076]